jgi:hypothetical protein
VTFLIDVNSAATSLMCASEHGTFAVLRHSSLPCEPSLICADGHVTPADLAALRN